MSYKISHRTTYEIRATALAEIKPLTKLEIEECVSEPEPAPRMATHLEMLLVIAAIRRVARGLKST